MTVSEEYGSNTIVSLEQLFPENTQQFLRPFEDIVSTDIHLGMQLDFEIKDRIRRSKKSPILRLARPEDALDIVEIYKELYEGTYPYKEMEDTEEVRQMIESPTCDWVVFKDINDNTIGCFTFILDFEDKKGYIRGLMIKKAYQGKVDVIKAVIGSYIGMYTKYKDQIYRWYCENRTAHSKSQYALSIGGIRPLAFYPNKDVFMGKVESDILHICYDQRAITTMRYNQTPTIIPEAANCFLYSTQRYDLGACNFDNSVLELDFKKIRQLRKKIKYINKKDKFDYETIRFSLEESESFFEFLYTPQIQNFEKTTYEVSSVEELYVFVELFMKCAKEWNIRYCEVFLSAYKSEHQKLFQMFGLNPRGYLPSWKYNKKNRAFEDHILFNYFEGRIDQDIQLIDEGKLLVEILDLDYFSNPKTETKEIPPIKKKISYIELYKKSTKIMIISSFSLYLLFLFMSMGFAFSQGYTMITNTISQLGTFLITPFPFLFDISSIFGGIATLTFSCYFYKRLKLERYQTTHFKKIMYQIPRYAIMTGGIGIILVGVFSLDRSFGLGHDICSGIAFGGFIVSLLGFSIMTFQLDINIPKYFGIGGILPFLTFVSFCIFSSPLSEWLLLFSIIGTVTPLYIGFTIT
ncbi:MAG: hypothetical protein ACFE9Z_04960 [Promethearchaeota archaeon]